MTGLGIMATLEVDIAAKQIANDKTHNMRLTCLSAYDVVCWK